MELTVGFIILFLFLVLPGMIFRRFYFLGEFSKQISVGEPILSTLAYSLIPGTIIQSFCAWLYHLSIRSINEEKLLDVLGLLWFSDLGDSVDLTSILPSKVLLYYTLAVYGFSAVLGFVLFTVVRATGLDCRLKILRFKNQWAYIFSGEIYKFPKFKKKHNSQSSVDDLSNLKYLFPYVDILAKVADGRTILYSGFAKDYDVERSDVGKLRRVYLFDAKRYKDVDGEKEQVSIPGDYLIINGSDIQNINFQYVYTDQAQLEQSQKERKWKSVRFGFVQFFNVSLILSILILGPLVFFKVFDWENKYYQMLFDIPWYQRVVFWFILNQLYGVLFPFALDPSSKTISFKGRRFLISNVVALVLSLTLWLWWIS